MFADSFTAARARYIASLRGLGYGKLALADADLDTGRAPAPGANPLADETYADLVILDDALAALSELDPRKGRVVELRFFGGLSVKATADVLAVSPPNRHAGLDAREGMASAGDEARSRRRNGRPPASGPSSVVTSGERA